MVSKVWPKLQFPEAALRLRNQEGSTQVFDIIRKGWFVLAPEEYVRQQLIHHLVNDLNYPLNNMAVEKQLVINNRKKRFDLLVMNRNGQPLMIVECKAPNVALTQEAFNQVAFYNFPIKAPWVMITNGLTTHTAKLDLEAERFSFVKEVPEFGGLI